MDSDKKFPKAQPKELSLPEAHAEAPGTPTPRIPEPVAGSQINVCKRPSCAHFGLPEHEHIKASDKSGSTTRRRLGAGGVAYFRVQ